ncbi:PROM1 protein, partial [Thinocorus orbignyianus]|nr:PROM1 protein [Thinocorus orbignyianus]
MELGNISQPTYSPGLQAPGSSSPGLVGMVHGFLRLVQPNALPVALRCFSFFLHQALIYDLGFLICAAIGILFIVLVPLVGCCFSCCRC